jgi:hypothetical protein
MPVIDYREIPPANSASGDQDLFELFARDYLAILGFHVVTEPNRGADGGRDFIVEETRSGVGGATRVRWLVSCKHKSHSGQSVSPSDEGNVRDRVEAAKCTGFLGFYSTLPSSGLASVLEGLRDKIQVLVYDREKIETELLQSSRFSVLAKRYFPKSYAKWKGEHPTPSDVFSETQPLLCENCGKNLLLPEPSGIVVILDRVRTDYEHDPGSVEDLYWCCKGQCDRSLKAVYRRTGLIDGWQDIPDILIPIMYARFIIAPMNKMKRGVTFSDEAFEKYKRFILCLYPCVARATTEQERNRIHSLMMIPSFLGGLGE